MSNNVVVKGLNSSFKYIGRGFSHLFLGGIKARFCRVSVEPHIAMKVSVR